MPPHELVGDTFERIGDPEVSGLRFELGEKHRLEHEISELLAELAVIVAVDRLENFVGFFQHERLERVDGLFPVPRTALGTAERRHDADQSSEFLSRAVGHKIWQIGSSSNWIIW